MKLSPQQVQVKHNPDRKRFEFSHEGKTAKCEYILTKSRIIFTHTEVPIAMEGNGIGAALAKFGLDYARAQELKVMPLCPFIASYIRKNPIYRDLIMAGIHI